MSLCRDLAVGRGSEKLQRAGDLSFCRFLAWGPGLSHWSPWDGHLQDPVTQTPIKALHRWYLVGEITVYTSRPWVKWILQGLVGLTQVERPEEQN